MERANYTKQDVLNKAKGDGSFLNTTGIVYDLDGKGMADYLTGLGFEVLRHWDAGTNGWVVCKEGIRVSTNGYCHEVDGRSLRPKKEK